MRELVYFVAVTLDGFIAGPGGEFTEFAFEGDHMDPINAEFGDTVPTHLAEHFGIAPSGRFGTVLMGADTYAVGLPEVRSPYRSLEQIVITHRDYPSAEGVRFVDSDPVALVRELKQESGADIWLCGGGALAGTLRGEIDRLVLKRHPFVYGAGIPLFGTSTYAPERIDLVRSIAFDSGVELTEYVRRQEP